VNGLLQLRTAAIDDSTRSACPQQSPAAASKHESNSDYQAGRRRIVALTILRFGVFVSRRHSYAARAFAGHERLGPPQGLCWVQCYFAEPIAHQ